MLDSDIKVISVVNSSQFKFTAADGLVAGHEYSIKVRAKNFYTNYYSVNGPYGGASTFYSSNVPKTVSGLTQTIAAQTKTDATITWVLHTDAADKGYSTIDPFYLLWMDDCNGGLF